MLDSALDMYGPVPELTPHFLKSFDACVPFDTNPLYALLHEGCYSSGGATKWAAQRVQDDKWAKLFDPVVCVKSSCIPWGLFGPVQKYCCCHESTLTVGRHCRQLPTAMTVTW